MKKIFCIIPGFGESTDMSSYTSIAQEALRSGYGIITFNPHWERRTASDWIADFQTLLDHYPHSAITVLGFSLGAYIAVLCTKKYNFEKLILCSVSPYFADNIKDVPESTWKFYGTRRKADFAEHMFPTDIASEAVFLVGELEIPREIQHVQERYAGWSGEKRLVIVKNAEHSLDSGEYLNELNKIIRKIR